MCCKVCARKQSNSEFDDFANYIAENKSVNIGILLQNFKGRKKKEYVPINLGAKAIGISTELSCSCSAHEFKTDHNVIE